MAVVNGNADSNNNTNSTATTTAITTVPLILNNKPITTPNRFDVISPLTRSPIYQCSSASVDDANRAAGSAKTAFTTWSRTTPVERQDIMLRAAEIYLRRKEELLGYCARETGSTGAFPEITFGIGYNILKDFAGRAAAIEGCVPLLGEEGKSAMVYKVPFGVILSIVPWNAPFPLALRAIVIPLMAGNTVVLKGSELSPKTLWAICDVFREAGLPDGCLNLIFHSVADSAEITTALIAHSAVRKVNFTGSTRVGSIVASLAGKYVKPVLMELGGKASSMVLDDADIKKAADDCILASFLNSGQICMSTERIIVQRSVAEDFRACLSKAMTAFHCGSNPSLVLVDAALVAKNRNLVANAIRHGADIVAGKIDDDGEEMSCSAEMRPVILENVKSNMDIYGTESFGPTVSLYVVDTEDEAIRLANDTEYGLTASVYTESLGRGLRVAKQLESGAIHINSITSYDNTALPHGGVKKSGFGRFGGTRGLDEFMTTKSVTWMDV